jgi:hypothetical protein
VLVARGFAGELGAVLYEGVVECHSAAMLVYMLVFALYAIVDASKIPTQLPTVCWYVMLTSDAV